MRLTQLVMQKTRRKVCGLATKCLWKTALLRAILTETVFSWPGIGLMMVRAIQVRDYPMVQGGVLFVAAVFVLVNIIVDIAYAFLDPRIRYR